MRDWLKELRLRLGYSFLSYYDSFDCSAFDASDGLAKCAPLALRRREVHAQLMRRFGTP